MYKSFFLSLLISISNAINAQDISVPVEARSFIVKEFEPLDYKTGDLNGDKKQDAILILKQTGEESLDIDDAAVRPLIILIRQPDGKLKQIARNDKAIMCRQCGGVMGDPYNGIVITSNGFTLSFYGGSSWRWETDYRFLYKPARKNWFLIKESQLSFHAGDPETTTKKTTIEEAELGEIAFEKFSSDNSEFEESFWKVIAAKTFFYDTPKLGSKPRKGYLIKGNEVVGIRQLKNFIEVNYTDGSYNTTSGYVLRKDLQRQKK